MPKAWGAIKLIKGRRTTMRGQGPSVEVGFKEAARTFKTRLARRQQPQCEQRNGASAWAGIKGFAIVNTEGSIWDIMMRRSQTSFMSAAHKFR